MFVRLAPQRVLHQSGYIVQVASRERVELIRADGSIVAIAADFGPVSALYRETLSACDPSGNPLSLDGEDSLAIVASIKAALEYMGGTYEIV